MKITKEFPGLTQIANGDYVLEGDLVIGEPVVENDHQGDRSQVGHQESENQGGKLNG